MLLVHHIALATANVIKTLLVCYYYCALASFECVCACWLPLCFCMFGDIFCVLCIIIWYLRVYIALCGRVSSILSPFSVARLVLCPPVIYIGSISRFHYLFCDSFNFFVLLLLIIVFCCPIFVRVWVQDGVWWTFVVFCWCPVFSCFYVSSKSVLAYFISFASIFSF